MVNNKFLSNTKYYEINYKKCKEVKFFKILATVLNRVTEQVFQPHFKYLQNEAWTMMVLFKFKNYPLQPLLIGRGKTQNMPKNTLSYARMVFQIWFEYLKYKKSRAFGHFGATPCKKLQILMYESVITESSFYHLVKLWVWPDFLSKCILSSEEN